MMAERSKLGFTLLETILSLALTAIVIAMLATLSKQWLSNWSLGANRIQTVEALALAETRLTEDIQASLSFMVRADNQHPAFVGSDRDLIFVREPRPVDQTNRLIVIRYTSEDQQGISRRTAIFDPQRPLNAQKFSAPIILLDAPYSFSLFYLNAQGASTQNWQESLSPEAISITLAGGNAKPLSTISIRPHVTLPSICGRTVTLKDCETLLSGSKPSSPLMPQNSAPQPGKSAP